MKHKTSKLLSILLALVMVAGLVPMTVNAAGDVDFSISPNPITFESKVVGYSNIGAAKSFTITNTGTDAINLAGADSSSFEIIGSFTGDYVNPGESKTYTVQHKHGLGKGTYDETITILGKSQADFNKSVTKELSLNFTVLGNEPNFTTTPNSITFETKTVGYGNDWKTIALKNTGEVTLNYSAVSLTYFRVNGLAGKYATPGDDITFDVAPELNLPVGNYNETLKITGTDQNNSLNKIEKEIQLSFTVTSSSTTTNMSADFTNVDFGTIEAGFTNEQAKTQLVRFTNTGTSTITLSNTNPTAQGPFSTYWYNNILQIAPGGYIEVNLKTDETSSFANTAGIYNGTYVFTATNISDSMDTFTISIPAKVVVTDSTPTEHTITVVDGSPSKTSAAKNETITITADAAPSGKEFDKWVIEEGTITLADANSSTTTFTMPDEDVKVKATYKDIAVTPTAPTITTSTLPGGKVGTAYEQTLAATGDATITWAVESGNLPAGLTLGTDGKISGTPTAAGDYTFTVKASNTAGDATKSFTVTIAPADATTYTVSFNANGGGGTMADVTNVPAGNYTLPTNGFTAPTNKEFDQWEVNGAKYDEGATITISGNTEVKALWKNKPVTKTLSSIAITTPPTKTTYTAGQSFNKAGMVVTATYSDSSTAPVTTYTVTPSGALKTTDTSVTVSYTEGGVTKTATQAITVNSSGGSGSGGGSATTKYTLTYNTNGGNSIIATKHDKNATVNLTATPTREGYNFTGWFADKELKNAVTSVKMDGNKTVYAGWKAAVPAEETPLLVVTINSMTYRLNGKTMMMDSAPFIDGNNRTMLPVRVIANALGISNDNIKWDNKTKTASFTRADGKVVSCTVNSNVIKIGDEEVTIDTVPVIRNDRIYLPMRALFNAFDVPDENIIWDAAARTVTVTEKD